MNINRNNYEVFFMDHLDGKLSPSLEQELHAFLVLNPDLAIEFEDVQSFMRTVLSPTADVFPDKSSLHKQEFPISTEALNELLVKEVDGNLSAQELLMLEKLQVEFPFIASSRLQFSKTKLPIESFRFENKQSLHFPEVLNMEDDEMRLIALMEGDLTSTEANKLQKRLSVDSKLAEQFVLLQKTKLKHVEVAFQSKKELRFEESIELSDRTQLLIAKLEGDLTSHEQSNLDIQLANDKALRSEFLLIQKTKLQAENISFDFKDSSRKKVTVIIPLRTRILSFSTAAAAVFGLILWLNYDRSESGASLASNFNPSTYSIHSHERAGANNLGQSNLHSGTSSWQEIYGELEIKDVAIVLPAVVKNDSIAARNSLPELMLTIPAHDLASVHEPTIMKDTPEMKLVMTHANNLQSQTSKQSVTLLSYLGKAATEKLENTFAYTLAERQVERFASHTRNELELERQEGESKDKIRFRIGSFAIQTDARKKKDSSGSFADRINKTYHRISGN